MEVNNYNHKDGVQLIERNSPKREGGLVERMRKLALLGTIAGLGVITPYSPLLEVNADTPSGGTTITHNVEWKETLGGLARKYNTCEEHIIELNKITDKNLIYMDQKLQISENDDCVGHTRSNVRQLSGDKTVGGLDCGSGYVPKIGDDGKKYCGITDNVLARENEILQEWGSSTIENYVVLPKSGDGDAKLVAAEVLPKEDDAKLVAIKALPKEDDAKLVAIKALPKEDDAKLVAIKALPKEDDAKLVAAEVLPKEDDAASNPNNSIITYKTPETLDWSKPESLSSYTLVEDFSEIPEGFKCEIEQSYESKDTEKVLNFSEVCLEYLVQGESCKNETEPVIFNEPINRSKKLFSLETLENILKPKYNFEKVAAFCLAPKEIESYGNGSVGGSVGEGAGVGENS